MSKFQLVVLAEDAKPLTYAVNQFGLFIGRSKAMDIPIDGNTVSRRHARVWNDNGSLLIEDLSSRNGIMVNGEIVKNAKLKEGDYFIIGGCQFHVADAAKPIDLASLEAARKRVALIPQAVVQPIPQPRAATAPTLVAPRPQLSKPPVPLSPVTKPSAPHSPAPASSTIARAAALHALVLDWDALINEITREALNIVPAQRASLIDTPRPTSVGIDVLASNARANNHDGPPINDMLIDRSVRRKEATRSGEAATDVTTYDIGLPQGGAICAPILGRETCLGVLYLDAGTNTSLQFTDEHLLALADFARYVAPALENAIKHRTLLLLARQAGAEEATATVRNTLTPIIAELKTLHGAPAIATATQRLQTLLTTITQRPQRP